jgi:CRP/FNR family cyclic AMP-dependent transcriptional regulator
MAGAAPLSELISSASILADLPAEQLDRLGAIGQLRSLRKGQTLFQKGERGDFIAIILSGTVKVCAFSITGAETVLNLLTPGEVLGEIAAIDGGARTADAIALEDCELLTISRASLLRQMSDDHDFTIALTRALCARLRRTSDALEATTLDMAGKVAAALLRLSQAQVETDRPFELSVDQTTLANFSGLTRSNLNRVLKRFERAGVTVHEKGVLRILNRESLEAFAERDDDI